MAGGRSKLKKRKGPQSMIGFRLKKDISQDIIDNINKHYLDGNLGEYINNALIVYSLLENYNILPLVLQNIDEQEASPTNAIEDNKDKGRNKNCETEEATIEIAVTQTESIIDTSKYVDAEDEIFGGNYKEPEKEKERVNFIKRLQENMEKTEREKLNNDSK